MLEKKNHQCNHHTPGKNKYVVKALIVIFPTELQLHRTSAVVNGIG